MHVTNTVLMIKPVSFGYNRETAANNFFQQEVNDQEDLQTVAVKEFCEMVNLLRKNDIEVIVFDDTSSPAKPDAVFPNNWLSTLPDGRIFIFPMNASSRQTEVRTDIVECLANHYKVSDVQDWTEWGAESRFLEGTGSMVMDHVNRIIYACLSERTHPATLRAFAEAIGYTAMAFHAYDKQGRPVYHTNVMMNIGESFAIVCAEAITDETERIAVIQLLEAGGKELIFIKQEQMEAFAGNMLELVNSKGKHFLIMSATAHQSLEKDQLEKVNRYASLLVVSVPAIETEGGSVRCMMAEIFLQPKTN